MLDDKDILNKINLDNLKNKNKKNVPNIFDQSLINQAFQLYEKLNKNDY